MWCSSAKEYIERCIALAFLLVYSASLEDDVWNVSFNESCLAYTKNTRKFDNKIAVVFFHSESWSLLKKPQIFNKNCSNPDYSMMILWSCNLRSDISRCHLCVYFLFYVAIICHNTTKIFLKCIPG